MQPVKAPIMSATTITVADAARWALYGALAAWGGLITVTQMDRAQRLRAKVSQLSLTLPTYRFFGPTPAMFDRHLLFREKLADGSLGDWVELDVETPRRRRLHHMVFGPSRRRQKSLHDSDSMLLKTYHRYAVGMGVVAVCPPYRTLLRLVTECVPHPPSAREVQFALGRSARWDASEEKQVIFASQFHPLPHDVPRQA